jgi:hypothetical protein
MDLTDVYNFNPLSFTSVSDELHSDLGASDYQIGIAARGFKGGADFVVKNVGYQEISNTGALGSFTGSTVAGIVTQNDWELDITIDSTLYQLDDIDINIANNWDNVCAATQTSLRAATGGTETVAIVSGKIRVTSKDSYGSGSSVLIEAGSAGTGSGDLLAAITALSADYTATIDTAVDGATLVEDTDYELSVIDQRLTNATKLYTTQFTVYTRIKILDADYQDTDLYLSYKIVNSNVDAAYFNYLNDIIKTLGKSLLLNNTIANNVTDSDHDIDIVGGTAVDSTGTKYLIDYTGQTKKIDAVYADGDGNGGLFSGASLSADTFYYIFMLEKDSDSSIQYGIDDNQNGTNIPAGYTYFRRLRGALLTDGSANILGFRQKNDDFRFNSYINNANDVVVTTSQTALSVSIPPEFIGVFVASLEDATVTNYILLTESTDTDRQPTSLDYDLSIISSVSRRETIIMNRLVDSSSQLFHRANTGSSARLRVQSVGFIDNA